MGGSPVLGVTIGGSAGALVVYLAVLAVEVLSGDKSRSGGIHSVVAASAGLALALGVVAFLRKAAPTTEVVAIEKGELTKAPPEDVQPPPGGTDSTSIRTTQTERKVPSSFAGRDCNRDGDCGDLRCFQGFCGVEQTTTVGGGPPSVLHWDRIDDSNSNVKDCLLPPGTLVVLLERGAPGTNWPVALPRPPEGCPQRNVYLHPSRMNIER
jgi:hypothetical protein